MSEQQTTPARRIKDMPVVKVRIEPNLQGTHILWRVETDDGAKASGFARSPGDAMYDAAAFVEAAMQPRRGSLWGKPGLRVIGKEPQDAE